MFLALEEHTWACHKFTSCDIILEDTELHIWKRTTMIANFYTQLFQFPYTSTQK